MADQFDETAAELLPCHGLLDQADCPCNHVKDVAVALRAVDTEAESRGFAEGVNAAVAYVQKVAAEMVQQIKGTK